uniref:Uncharacterized protein n=1 Tax=Arundo donax TaxID=35708 RepID=A0A0A9DS41_ARUDO
MSYMSTCFNFNSTFIFPVYITSCSFLHQKRSFFFRNGINCIYLTTINLKDYHNVQLSDTSVMAFIKQKKAEIGNKNCLL